MLQVERNGSHRWLTECRCDITPRGLMGVQVRACSRLPSLDLVSQTNSVLAPEHLPEHQNEGEVRKVPGYQWKTFSGCSTFSLTESSQGCRTWPTYSKCSVVNVMDTVMLVHCSSYSREDALKWLCANPWNSSLLLDKSYSTLCGKHFSFYYTLLVILAPNYDLISVLFCFLLTIPSQTFAVFPLFSFSLFYHSIFYVQRPDICYISSTCTFTFLSEWKKVWGLL